MPRRTLGLLLLLLVFTPAGHTQDERERDPSWVDGPIHNGVEITVDLPPDQHVKNIGAPKDQKGLCVFASMDMAARWHHLLPLIGIINKLQEGGGWPERVDKVVQEHAPGCKYVQYEGASPGLLDAALSIRSPACVTYGYSPRYGGVKTIYHMVLLVHIDKNWAAILDNNFPENYEWMSREEFLRRWTHPNGKGWAYTFLEAPAPPIPRSAD